MESGQTPVFLWRDSPYIVGIVEVTKVLDFCRVAQIFVLVCASMG